MIEFFSSFFMFSDFFLKLLVFEWKLSIQLFYCVFQGIDIPRLPLYFFLQIIRFFVLDW